MRWRPALAACGAALALGGACSSAGEGGDDADVTDGDGASDGCHAIDEREERGEVSIGTGYDAFVDLTDEIRIIAGPQGGFHLNLNARIQGLDLGNIDDLLDPSNPSTLFGIYAADGGERLDMDVCPVRVGYRAEGDFGVLPRGVSVVFDVEDVEELAPLFDAPVLVRVEVIDVDGRHSADERAVVVRAPILPP